LPNSICRALFAEHSRALTLVLLVLVLLVLVLLVLVLLVLCSRSCAGPRRCVSMSAWRDRGSALAVLGKQLLRSDPRASTPQWMDFLKLANARHGLERLAGARFHR
jgi:hypothetical protein